MLAEALNRLYARIPLGMRLGLETMRGACARMGHPERGFPAVHVAGTNGKGSVCAMLESIALAHGLKTGLYTSPHLCRFAERIRIRGEPIDDPSLAALLSRVLQVDPELSFFEVATLTAFLAFRDAQVDVAILEVGLGGRFDATNVIPRPLAAAITRIALDHTDRLGSTLVHIAREKAGIAKPGLDIVLGRMPPDVRAAIDEVAHAAGATTSNVEDMPVPRTIGLDGEHQRDNAQIAAVLGHRIGASPAEVHDGLARARWPGRLERIGRFLLDAAHNPDSAEALARYLRSLGVPPQSAALVFGTLADKDWAPMLDALAPLATTRIYVPPLGGSRGAADLEAMRARHQGALARSTEEALSRFPRGSACSSVSESSDPHTSDGSACSSASESSDPHIREHPGGPPSLVVVAGSIVLVGEARSVLLGLPRDPPVAL
jgi:dihydrofolate synthase/folylpolyglutamate synthase